MVLQAAARRLSARRRRTSAEFEVLTSDSDADDGDYTDDEMDECLGLRSGAIAPAGSSDVGAAAATHSPPTGQPRGGALRAVSFAPPQVYAIPLNENAEERRDALQGARETAAAVARAEVRAEKGAAAAVLQAAARGLAVRAKAAAVQSEVVRDAEVALDFEKLFDSGTKVEDFPAAFDALMARQVAGMEARAANKAARKAAAAEVRGEAAAIADRKAKKNGKARARRGGGKGGGGTRREGAPAGGKGRVAANSETEDATITRTEVHEPNHTYPTSSALTPLVEHTALLAAARTFRCAPAHLKCAPCGPANDPEWSFAGRCHSCRDRSRSRAIRTLARWERLVKGYVPLSRVPAFGGRRCGDVKFLVAERWHLEKECARGRGDWRRDPRSNKVLRDADGRCCYVYEDVYVWDGFEWVGGPGLLSTSPEAAEARATLGKETDKFGGFVTEKDYLTDLDDELDYRAANRSLGFLWDLAEQLGSGGEGA